jgi:hypothetical protein
MYLRIVKEPIRLKPRKVGVILAALGFKNRFRTARGWMLSFEHSDRVRAHRLVRAYGIDNGLGVTKPGLNQDCELRKDLLPAGA